MFSAQSPAADEILANPNRTLAGKLENGVLTVHLEMREGTWHAEADDGPPLYVQAFAEAGRPASIPGPLLRMPVGTTVKVMIDNKLKKPATVFGLNTRPGDPKTGIAIPAGESRETTFLAGAAGTYYYWARTVSPGTVQQVLQDAQLNGAFIIDPPGPVPPDRIFVLNVMVTRVLVLSANIKKQLQLSGTRWRNPVKLTEPCRAWVRAGKVRRPEGALSDRYSPQFCANLCYRCHIAAFLTFLSSCRINNLRVPNVSVAFDSDPRLQSQPSVFSHQAPGFCSEYCITLQ